MRPSAVVLVTNQKSKDRFLQLFEYSNGFKYKITSVFVYSEFSIDSLKTIHEVQTVLCYQLAIPFYDFKDLLEAVHHNGLSPKFMQITGPKNNGNVHWSVRDLSIDDMFIKETNFKLNKRHSEFKAMSVLVTGGAGSIGSELCRQLSACQPKQLVIIDQNEAGLWSLKQELLGETNEIDATFLLVDITQNDQLDHLFNKHSFDIVIHAAAYKQLPLLQENLFAACNTNFMATVNLANYAAKYRVKTFLNLSTDKAVQPTSNLGITKRAAELYLEYLNNEGKASTHFYSVRLGNVVGSVGSVVPMFIKQVKTNRDLTITHLEAQRFFISNKSVSQLLICTLLLNTKESTMIFKLEEAVKIVDLAQTILWLYTNDFSLNITEKTKIIGLRNGEKLGESLYYPEAQKTPTDNEFIYTVKERANQCQDIAGIVSKLAAVNSPNNTDQIEKLLRSAVFHKTLTN